MNSSITRRSALKALTGTAAIAAVATDLHHRLSAAESAMGTLRGHVNHSVCKWCYNDIPLEEFCVAAKEIGLASVELLQPSDIPTLRQHGLTCAMISNPTIDGLGGITRAFNRVEHHDKLLQAYEQQIKASAELGLKNVICFSGNRDGLDDEQGLKNCAIGLKRLMPVAEKHQVVIAMELLNSKVNHRDYQCDHTAWGVELCQQVGSENFKLLYDIYHMQIMEGDMIATIRRSREHIAHYHTGGVPGRNEIDETQEIYYPAVMKAILDTGFKGFVAQEFIPKREDKIASLKQGVRICDI